MSFKSISSGIYLLSLWNFFILLDFINFSSKISFNYTYMWYYIIKTYKHYYYEKNGVDYIKIFDNLHKNGQKTQAKKLIFVLAHNSECDLLEQVLDKYDYLYPTFCQEDVADLIGSGKWETFKIISKKIVDYRNIFVYNDEKIYHEQFKILRQYIEEKGLLI